MSRKAFTLIELLVVIAIIAILAAILFPVFAQAKDAAKKTTSISNAKQTGVSIAIYQTDSDDLFPIAYTAQADGLLRTWIGGAGLSGARFPYDISPTTTTFQHQIQWANSTMPYRKSAGLTEITGAPVTPVTFTAIQKEPQAIGLTINGLLSTYNPTSIESPSDVPLLWPGLGKTNVKGLAWVNPVLDCGLPAAGQRAGMSCTFNPGGAPNPAFTGTRAGIIVGFTDAAGKLSSAWIHGQGTVIVRTDTSAKFIKVGGGNINQGNNNPFGDPWSRYEPNNGVPYGNAYYCTSGDGPVSTSNPQYPCFFMPNR